MAFGAHAGAVCLQAVALCMLPTHFFFQFLFYTDVAGLLFLLISFEVRYLLYPVLVSLHLPQPCTAPVACRWQAVATGIRGAGSYRRCGV